MNKYKIVGVGSYDFADKTTGRQVSGYKYHMISAGNSAKYNTEGQDVMTATVGAQVMAAWQANGSYIPKIGDVVTPLYDQHGKLQGFLK